MCGWPSAAMLELQSVDENGLAILPTGPLTADEASWVTSLMCIGGFVGNSFFGWFADRFGRKMPLILCAVPQLVYTEELSKCLAIESNTHFFLFHRLHGF